MLGEAFGSEVVRVGKVGFVEVDWLLSEVGQGKPARHETHCSIAGQ